MVRPRSQQRIQKQRKSTLRCGIGFTVGCGAATRKETCGQPWQNSSTESRKRGSKKPSAANSGVTLFYNLIFEVTCALFVLDLKFTIVQHQCTFFIKNKKSIKRPSFDLVNTLVGFVSLSAGMSSHDVVAPKKRRRMGWCQ